MKYELLKLYSQLSKDDQRNEFSSLLIKIDNLLNELLTKNGLPNMKNIKNYDIKNGNMISDSEILEFFYEDLWDIKNKILALLIANDKGANNE